VKFAPPDVSRIDFSADGKRVEVRVHFHSHERYPEGDRTQIVVKCILPYEPGSSVAQLRERALQMAHSMLRVEIAQPLPDRTLEQSIRAQLDRNDAP
jgi:hypothetical protein